MFWDAPHRAAFISAVIMACGLCACAPISADKDMKAIAAPRIVSLDFCADQYALELLPKSQILALSPDARTDFSYHKTRAAGVAQVRPRAEDVLALKPDLVLRSYGGGPQAARLYKAAGVPVINIGWANHLRGESEGSVSALMRDVAAQLKVSDKGEALIQNYHARLAALSAEGQNRSHALYMTPYGVTTGPGSLVHDMIELAGFENFESRAGWRPLPLERLTSERPEFVITGFFDSHQSQTANWSSMRHPIAKAALEASDAISLKGAWTSCGAWFLLDAVEEMQAAKGTPK